MAEEIKKKEWPVWGSKLRGLTAPTFAQYLLWIRERMCEERFLLRNSGMVELIVNNYHNSKHLSFVL